MAKNPNFTEIPPRRSDPRVLNCCDNCCDHFVRGNREIPKLQRFHLAELGHRLAVRANAGPDHIFRSGVAQAQELEPVNGDRALRAKRSGGADCWQKIADRRMIDQPQLARLRQAKSKGSCDSFTIAYRKVGA